MTMGESIRLSDQKTFDKTYRQKSRVITLVGRAKELRNHFTNKINVAPTTSYINTLKLITEQHSSTGENYPLIHIRK